MEGTLKVKSKVFWVYLFSLVFFVFVLPYLSPYDPNRQFVDGLSRLGLPLPPNSKFVLGTDVLGRDLLSRLIFGIRISLEVGFFASLFSSIFGTFLGIIAGYFGGVVDRVVLSLMNLFISVPSVLIIFILILKLGTGLFSIVVAIAIVDWVYFSRVIREKVRALKGREFVLASRSVGVPEYGIVISLLPLLREEFAVLFSAEVATSILTESALSFLGLGVKAPNPSLGNIIFDNYSYFFQNPMLVIAPGLSIFIIVYMAKLVEKKLKDENK